MFDARILLILVSMRYEPAVLCDLVTGAALFTVNDGICRCVVTLREGVLAGSFSPGLLLLLSHVRVEGILGRDVIVVISGSRALARLFIRLLSVALLLLFEFAVFD